MAGISLNTISPGIFRVSAAETADGSPKRADLVASGRLLTYEYARKGQRALSCALGREGSAAEAYLDAGTYKSLNERFQNDLVLYAARQVCQFTGEAAPETLEEFRRNSLRFYGNSTFYQVLQGIVQEIVSPVLPRVLSEAVGVFAEVVPVGFGETYCVTMESDDIPVFQDSSWGAARSVPRNRFYSRDITLNPQPKTAGITAKWTQLAATGTDFGRFFANLTAGMYARIMAMWSAAMTAAASDTTMIPTGLTYTYSTVNWVTLANKVAALNGTQVTNLIACGGLVPLSKILPNTVTGATNVDMDAAVATLLGADYVRAGYLGEYMGVRLMPLTDAIQPTTRNTQVNTMLDANKVWIMAANGRKPLTIAYNDATPLQVTMEPSRSADFEIGINLTMCLDSVAVFANRVGLITVT